MLKNFEQFNPKNSNQAPQLGLEKQEKIEIKAPIENDPEIKQARDLFAKTFEEYEEGQQRIEAIIKRLDYLLKSNAFDNKQIQESLIACSFIEDKEKFVNNVMSALKPIITFKKENPEIFAQIRREAVITQAAQDGMRPINEILYYGEHDNYIHIHLAPAQDLGIRKLITLVLEGLQKLAEVVKNNEQIQEISATSWIVAHESGARIMERLGFELRGEIDEKLRRQYFSEDKRKISKATISREEFLKRYLK